jgi:hypothetical protein
MRPTERTEREGQFTSNTYDDLCPRRVTIHVTAE